MKILSIRLKNLNSLKGDHFVDLAAEPLASAGLFAITGPTGAGKSTLLDAVTLALYGKAARYGSESNPEHVMSRHCGECSAEVVFEVPSGVFRAVWERHRARKKADGQLQQPKRYIYDAAGQPLTQQIREAEQKIEELIGLDYERFLRSALLAQGEFSKFLKADDNERAELLESLTGTEIYSRLGAQAHAEATRRENELLLKEAGLNQITVLADDVRAEVESAIQEGEQKRTEIVREIESGSEALGRIARLEEARSKERAALAAQGQAEKDVVESAANLEKLRRHRLTLPFGEKLARLDAAEKASVDAAAARKMAETKHATAKAALHRANHLLRTSIGSSLTDQRKNAKDAEAAIQTEAIAAEAARGWLDANKQDAVLGDILGDVIAAIGDVKSKRGSLANNWESWRDRASQILPEAAKELPDDLASTKAEDLTGLLESYLGKAKKHGKALQADVAKAKKQLDLRQDHLDKAKLIAKLEDQRHTLKAGEPCPLCGALEHPYADGAAPSPRLAELTAEVTAAKGTVTQTEEAYRALASSAEQLAGDGDSLQTGLRDSEKALKALKDLLTQLSVDLPEPGGEDVLRASLQKRDRDYRAHVKAEEGAIRRKDEAGRSATSAAEMARELGRKLAKIAPLPPDYKAESIPAKQLLTVDAAEEVYLLAVQEEKTTGVQIQDRLESEKKAVSALTEAKAPLEAEVAASEFKDLVNLRKARLPTTDVQRLETLDAKLTKQTTEANIQLEQARKDIGNLLLGEVLEGQAAADFKVRQSELKKQNEGLLVEQTTRRSRIQTDDENRATRSRKTNELADERAHLLVWRRLRELIGSADGSKFRRYAQSITLDILTRHANRHLAKLSDRYRIGRDPAQVLTLQIEDLHQAGVRRPMASLSGGESFLASLALALGLSDLAGRTVRIDSLFIDEGFGSLDPETLEVAIAALESLRQDHKTVGIISHVGLLKERIGTQIVVEKKAGGVSRIRVIPEETAA